MSWLVASNLRSFIVLDADNLSSTSLSSSLVYWFGVEMWFLLEELHHSMLESMLKLPMPVFKAQTLSMVERVVLWQNQTLRLQEFRSNPNFYWRGIIESLLSSHASNSDRLGLSMWLPKTCVTGQVLNLFMFQFPHLWNSKTIESTSWVWGEALNTGVGKSFGKKPDSKYFRFLGSYNLTTIQLCEHSTKAIDNTWVNGFGCVPKKLYL